MNFHRERTAESGKCYDRYSAAYLALAKWREGPSTTDMPRVGAIDNATSAPVLVCSRIEHIPKEIPPIIRDIGDRHPARACTRPAHFPNRFRRCITFPRIVTLPVIGLDGCSVASSWSRVYIIGSPGSQMGDSGEIGASDFYFLRHTSSVTRGKPQPFISADWRTSFKGGHTLCKTRGAIFC